MVSGLSRDSILYAVLWLSFVVYLIVGERLKKPVPLQEQTVKDAKGRYQRFHGAFTGGFSAGYFNTVGTKEGQISFCHLGRVIWLL